jgi:DNA mismatch repair ATPase MutL
VDERSEVSARRPARKEEDEMTDVKRRKVQRDLERSPQRRDGTRFCFRDLFFNVSIRRKGNEDGN